MVIRPLTNIVAVTLRDIVWLSVNSTRYRENDEFFTSTGIVSTKSYAGIRSFIDVTEQKLFM